MQINKIETIVECSHFGRTADFYLTRLDTGENLVIHKKSGNSFKDIELTKALLLCWRKAEPWLFKD